VREDHLDEVVQEPGPRLRGQIQVDDVGGLREAFSFIIWVPG
jgi:hypothetical protein